MNTLHVNNDELKAERTKRASDRPTARRKKKKKKGKIGRRRLCRGEREGGGVMVKERWRGVRFACTWGARERAQEGAGPQVRSG